MLTDGLGGFAMGTAAGIPTRRYHAWLIAATTPPIGRMVALSNAIEEIVEHPGADRERRFELSSFQFPGAVHPSGHDALVGFESGSTVKWKYEFDGGGIAVTRELCLLRPEQRADDSAGGAVIVRYSIEAPGRDVVLRVRPLVAMRDFHGLLAGRACPDRFRVESAGRYLRGVVGIEVAGQYAGSGVRLNLAFDGATFASSDQWWYDFEYRRDAERGQDHREDLFSPGVWEAQVIGGSASLELHAWTGRESDRPGVTLDRARLAIDRRESALVASTLSRVSGGVRVDIDDELRTIAALVRAGDRFIVRRDLSEGARSVSVIAGYPWFADWGRDTMICIPGLMLATGRFAEARKTLETFAGLRRSGLIPNWFDDTTKTAEYNTVDAALWYVHAACQYIKMSGDHAAVDGPIGKACVQIIEAYQSGTEHNIRMCDDGLIAAGDPTTQLTWMDARRDGVVFTPRYGKPVEINALWYNALCSLAETVAPVWPTLSRELRLRAEHAGASFREKFWNPRARACHDVLIPESPPGGRNGKWRAGLECRPNQIFAASLPFSPLDEEQRDGVIETVRQRLLSPHGLRTLAPADPGYIGRFRGSLFELDRAYHNGTVWPWLIGPFVEAVLRLHKFSQASCDEARRIVATLVRELDAEAPGRMLGQLPEVYDGDDRPEEPRRPGGCPAQAWSVSELLRVLVLMRSGRAGAEN